MKHLLSKWEFKVKPFHFEDVTVKTITSLEKITLVTSGPHGSQRNGSSLLLLLTTAFCYMESHSPLGSATWLHLTVQMGLETLQLWGFHLDKRQLSRTAHP